MEHGSETIGQKFISDHLHNKKQLKLKLNTSINKTTHLSQTILVKLISDS